MVFDMSEQFMKTTIREVLLNPTMNQCYFCLPPDKDKWSLDTIGKFTLDLRDLPPDSNEDLPEEVEKYGWIPTLSGADIESIVEVAKQELKNPSIEDLFESFIYYFEHDAFREYDDY